MRTAAVNGVDLYYETGGSGEPIVLVPGAANNLEWFRPLFATVGRRHTYVAFDYRGCGRSGPTGPFGITDLADDVFALMDMLGHDRFCVVGLSMGGMVAQEMLVRGTDRIRRAVLLSSGWPRVPTEMRAQLESSAPPSNALLANRAKPAEERVAEVAPVTFSASFLRSSRFEDYTQWAIPLAAAPEVLELFLRAAFDHDVLDLLPKVDVPVLVVCGTADQLAPDTVSRQLAELIPESQLLLLNGGSHAMVYERPRWMADTLLWFLSSDLDHASGTNGR